MLVHVPLLFNNDESCKIICLGFNVTVLAYGQTGSGKTHTMGTAYRQWIQGFNTMGTAYRQWIQGFNTMGTAYRKWIQGSTQWVLQHTGSQWIQGFNTMGTAYRQWIQGFKHLSFFCIISFYMIIFPYFQSTQLNLFFAFVIYYLNKSVFRKKCSPKREIIDLLFVPFFYSSTILFLPYTILHDSLFLVPFVKTLFHLKICFLILKY